LESLLEKHQQVAEAEKLRRDEGAFRELILKQTSDPAYDGQINTRLRLDHAQFSSRHGYWKEATADFKKVIEAEPTEHLHYHFLIPLLIASQEAGWLLVDAYMVISMAHYKNKQLAEARLAFEKGAAIERENAPRLEAGDLGPRWGEWIYAHALMKEAQALIEPGEKSGGLAK